MKLALVGNPNSGKTTMFNALTGRRERVGNWAGVTVEMTEHPLRRRFAADESVAVDLPGAYSMSPFTSEERITGAYVRHASPDVIVNIVDATNLSRSLFFTTQLLELGIPTVVALNKSDIHKRKNNTIDTQALSQLLGCPVVETTAARGQGLTELVACARAVVGGEQSAPFIDAAADACDKAAAEASDRRRFAFVEQLVRKVERRQSTTYERTAADKLDDILTGRWTGLAVFAIVMFAVFWLSQVGPAVWLADALTGWLQAGQEALASLLGEGGIWSSILIDGMIGGFIAIVGFLPLVMVMYFLIALLEDCGYMARATVVLDPVFKRVGLSGKSVISFVIGTGCAIPGVMACRTIRDERERRATALLTPFMPCGAKLPVIALFAGAFFGGSAWVGAAMYFVGIAVILLCALLVNAVTGYRARRSYFIIELPEYKAPSVPKALSSMAARGWAYIVKAGTVILVCNTAVHLMQSFTWRLTPVADGAADTSILATLAAPFALMIAPVVGVVAWQLAAATVTGFIAKENVVATLAVSFGIANLFDLDELAMLEGGAGTVASVFGISSAAAMAFLVLNLFTPPCFAAIGAMRSELKSAKWLWGGIGLQLSVGYTLGFLTFFFGSLLTGQSLGEPWMPLVGWGVVLCIGAVYAYLIRRARRSDTHHTATPTTKETVC